MEGEVWLNIDYGQYEITKRSFDTVAGKIATKIIAGNTDQKSESYFRGCIQNVRLGSRENANLEVAFEKNIATCKDDDSTVSCSGKSCPDKIAGKVDSDQCPVGDQCVCPFESKPCVEDSCKLDLW